MLKEMYNQDKDDIYVALKYFRAYISMFNSITHQDPHEYFENIWEEVLRRDLPEMVMADLIFLRKGCMSEFYRLKDSQKCSAINEELLAICEKKRKIWKMRTLLFKFSLMDVYHYEALQNQKSRLLKLIDEETEDHPEREK